MVAGGNRCVVDEIPINATPAVGSAHLFIVPETQPHDTGPVAVVSDKGSFRENLQSRIKAEREFPKHAGVTTGCGQFLINFVGIDSLDCDMAADKVEEEIAAFVARVWSHRGDRYSELRASETPGLERKPEMSYIGG